MCGAFADLRKGHDYILVIELNQTNNTHKKQQQQKITDADLFYSAMPTF